MNQYIQILKSKISVFLRENLNAPLYVEYLSQKSDEVPFEKQGKKWEFVWAKYPDGKRDIGVYSFSEDLVYAYQPWRKMVGIDKDGENVGVSLYDRHFKSDLKEENPITTDDIELEPELDFTDTTTEPDYESDAFVQDVVSGGYDVSISGKHIGHFDEMNVALFNLKKEMQRSNYFPTIWFISDHGNYWPIDENGNEIKNDLQERISPELFKSAINVSKERGTDRRTSKLGGLYFHKFIGMPLMGGKISQIETHNPSQANYRTVQIQIENTFNNAPVVPDSLKYNYISYDIDKDIYDIDFPIERKDAFILSKIALLINPDSKYKETGKYFQINGMNENIHLKENFERNKEIASTIINQLGGFGKLKAMTGAYNFVAVENGVSFRIKNPSANYIKIVLNANDYYDVEIGRIRGANYKILVDEKDVPVENLKSLIEKTTGMKLSLFENSNDITNGNLIPDNIIATFYDRIFKLLNQGQSKEDESIQRELNRILALNGGKLPKEIQDLVDYPNYKNLFENDESEKCYIMYLDASNGFKKTKKEFNSFEDAEKWGRENISNFNLDMISYSNFDNLYENIEIQSDIESEIENRFRPSDSMLSYSDINDIALEYNIDFEDVMQMAQAYANKRHEERKSDLSYWVKELITQYGYEHNNEIPNWNEFYSSWNSEGFQDENSWATEQDVKTEFTKQTSNPNQLSLFENISIKKIVENQISDEEESRKYLENLKSQNKITLSIGNHGLIFMQVKHSNNGLKSYPTYKQALDFYTLVKASIAAKAQHEINKMIYQNQVPGYVFNNKLYSDYMKEFIDITDEIYNIDYELSQKLIMKELRELSKKEGEEYYYWWTEDERDESLNQD